MTVYRVPALLSWSGPGAPGANVWHVRTDAAWGTDHAQLQGCVDTIHAFYTSLVGILATGVKVDIGNVVNVADQTTAAPTFTTVSSTNVSGAAPWAVAICVGWRTSIAARRGMGRTFISPLGANTQDTDGTPFASTMTTIRNAATALISSSTGLANGAIGVYGLLDKAPKDTPPRDLPGLPHVLRDFTGSAVRDTFAVMTSRRD